MKKLVNFLMTIFAPLAAAPTGWAIFAGITEQPAFPVFWPIALIGSVSIIVVTLSATVLISDAYYFQQTAKTKFEKAIIQPLWWSGSILVIAVLAEIVLSLAIVILDEYIEWGVLAFPVMTLAGAFAAAGHLDLQNRSDVRDLERAREQAKKETLERKKQQELEERRQKAREAYAERKAKEFEAKAKQEQKERELKLAQTEQLEALKCKFSDNGSVCGWQAENKKQLAGHMKAHSRKEKK